MTLSIYLFFKQTRNKQINFYENNLLITYENTENTFIAVRSDKPINRSLGIYYFEVEIIEIKDDV